MATRKKKKKAAGGKASTKKASGAEKAPIIKATTHGASGGSGKANALQLLFAASEEAIEGVITPPYDFAMLYKLFENSGPLRPNVDAYVTNIDSFGHHFTPNIDMGSTDADTQIADAIYFERFLRAGGGGLADLDNALPDATEEEVEHAKTKLKRRARIEYASLKSFFGFCCPDMSFTELRRRTRQDIEVTGNGFWEVTRNDLNEVANFYYIRPIYMRLTSRDAEPTIVEEYTKTTPITWKSVHRERFFRRFVRIQNDTKPVYFKELGDPRVVSQDTGVAYRDKACMLAEEPEAREATEMIHFLVFSPDTVYGVPRWISNLPAVLGSRELDEVNLNYFKNNVVPPLALLVSGGRFGKGVTEKIEEYIEEHLKGRKGQHRILVLEAEGQKSIGEPGPRAVPQVKFIPLRDAQQSDALFQNYDKRNEEKVAKSFRLPRILRGDDSGQNRATAFAALRFAEEQVFEPEREAFDSVINRQVLPLLDIDFWSFRSNSPIIRDPEKMVDMVRGLVKDGVLLPKEARELAQDIFNRTFIEISEDWTNSPLPITLAQLRRKDAPDIDAMLEEVEEVMESTQRKPDEADDLPDQTEYKADHVLVAAGTPIRSLGYDEK